VKKLAGYKKKYPLHYKKMGGLKMQHVIDEICRLTQGQGRLWPRMWGNTRCGPPSFTGPIIPDNWLSSGEVLAPWAMACPRPSAHSSAVPRIVVICIAGDGGFQMTYNELATAALHRLAHQSDRT
jgi:acetolactate synthase-1/2/3 large subunit